MADLYNELTMPPKLRTAHQQNDRVVMQAYGFRVKDTQTGNAHYLSETETIAELMKLYQQLTNK